MRTAVIYRGPSTDDGTFGRLILDDGTTYHSLELPWRGNEHGISCVPAGAYRLAWRTSPAHGPCYYVTGVPGRADIEIHAANWAGDVALGKYCELKGCVALGQGLGELETPAGKMQPAITQSKAAIEDFFSRCKEEPVQLVIHPWAGASTQSSSSPS